MKTISISEGQKNFVKIVDAAENRVSYFITEHDAAVAVMIPYDEYIELTEPEG